MKVKLDTILTDITGKPLIDQADESKLPLTVGRACTGALLSANPRENVEGAEKFRRWQIAQKLNGVKSVELTVEEVALVKKLVGDAWTTPVVGPVWQALEGKDEK